MPRPLRHTLDRRIPPTQVAEPVEAVGPPTQVAEPVEATGTRS